MTPHEHWTLRIFALLLIAACTVKCAPRETILVVAPTPNYTPDNGTHPLTAEQLKQLEERKHPKPIAPHNLDGYFADYRWFQ